MAATSQPSSRKRKIAAVAAGALVVGIGATYTLASWNDSEWVWGGADGDVPGIGTETFNIQQNLGTAFGVDDSAWSDEPVKDGGRLTFQSAPLSLTPGDTIYAPVALRTDANSLGANVTLQGAVKGAAQATDVNDKLWEALQVAVYTQSTSTADFARTGTCDAAGIGNTSNWTQVSGVTSLSTKATAAQSLTKNQGSVQHYCFAITLPAAAPGQENDKSLQGRTVAPAWEFKAESVAE